MFDLLQAYFFHHLRGSFFHVFFFPSSFSPSGGILQVFTSRKKNTVAALEVNVGFSDHRPREKIASFDTFWLETSM